MPSDVYTANAGPQECRICFAECKPCNAAPACGHSDICRSCHQDWIHMRIKNGDAKLVCPAGCGRLLTDGEVLKYAHREDFLKFRRASSPTGVATQCSLCRSFRFHDKRARWIRCDCGIICRRCGDKRRLACFLDRCVQQHDAEFRAWARGRDMKRCPECAVVIEKVGLGSGQKTTCGSCGHEFFWCCGLAAADEKEHGSIVGRMRCFRATVASEFRNNPTKACSRTVRGVGSACGNAMVNSAVCMLGCAFLVSKLACFAGRVSSRFVRKTADCLGVPMKPMIAESISLTE